MELETQLEKRFSQEFKDKVVQTYIESDMGCRKIAKLYGVGKTAVWRWIANFAQLNPNNTRLMDKIRANRSSNEGNIFYGNLDFGNAKGEKPADSHNSSNDLEIEIVRLKEALRRAELRADIYNEMINVAEAKFNIGIRKKAGAKQ